MLWLALIFSPPRRAPIFTGRFRAGNEQTTPTETELRDFCNLGYARQCARIPTQRSSDAVRFAIAKDRGKSILLHYCCERDHAPVSHGRLEYDCAAQTWLTGHDDACIQRQAECYLLMYLERRGKLQIAVSK